jgi:DNA-directed RNA polymerase subunit RPC12/RpoP
MKVCRDCDRLLPLSDYYKHSQMADGHLNKCKDCVRKRVGKHREENLETVQEYDRKRGSLPKRVKARKEYKKTDAYKESHRKANEKYKHNHKEKSTARYLLRRQVLAGKIPVAPCAICRGKAEAHHEDYSKPLEVNWLCDAHHKARHKQLNEFRRKGLNPTPIEEFIRVESMKLYNSVV